MAEQKINKLHEINICEQMEVMTNWDNKNTDSILDNHPHHQQFLGMLKTEIENIE